MTRLRTVLRALGVPLVFVCSHCGGETRHGHAVKPAPALGDPGRWFCRALGSEGP